MKKIKIQLSMSTLLNFVLGGAALVLAGLLLGVILGIFILWRGTQFEDLQVLQAHEPALFTKVYDRHGDIIDIISAEKRIILDFEDFPRDFVNALVALEDEDFFRHIGVSPLGIIAAVKDRLLKDRRMRGASTLTQQLVKNITKDTRDSFKRKFKEQLLAVQLELDFTKEELFAMYANEVPFGNNQFGIEAAARFYFGKTVGSLTLAECAMLAGIPQAPSRFNPFRNPDSCVRKRDLVLRRMFEEGYITEEAFQKARVEPLELADRRGSESRPVAGHFVDMVRQHLFDKYGEDLVRTSGWDIHTTLDLQFQRIAEQSVREGLKEVDKTLGYRSEDAPSVFKGRKAKAGSEGAAGEGENPLYDYFDPSWHRAVQEGASIRAVVMEIEPEHLTVRIAERTFKLEGSNLPMISLKHKKMSDYFKPGDVPLFKVVRLPDAPPAEKPSSKKPKDGVGPEDGDEAKVDPFAGFTLELDQEPDIEGAFLAIDPKTGDLLAMVGAYDYGRSKFNRADQAKRQVGSAFKPIIFGAAFEQGYTLADNLTDEPTIFVDPTKFSVDEAGELQPIVNPTLARRIRLGLVPKPEPYEPHNYHNTSYVGKLTLRQALAQSKNIVSVKLLNSVGYDHVLEYAHRLGLGGNNLQPFPSLALGAMEISLKDMVYAYSPFANAGIRYEPRFISLIMDNKGRLIEENPVKGSQAISPQNAFLVAEGMRSVIEDEKGSARAARRLRMPLAGKTGTTNDYTDAWFIGFNPSIVAGAWVGRDLKQIIGRGNTGGSTALPIWISFMEGIRDQVTHQWFEMPEGITKEFIDRETGNKITPDCDCDSSEMITEYFPIGAEPTEICQQADKDRLSLPWYLQRRSFDYDPGSGVIKPTWVWIDYASQQRARRFLENEPNHGVN